MSKKVFFGEMLKNWRQTGSVTPSSRFLTNKILSGIDFEKARLIVEFGPGVGTITTRLLKKMHPDCRLIILELNVVFCEILNQIKDPRLTVKNISATDLPKILGDSKVDYIVSGLPLAVFDRIVTQEILAAAKQKMKPEGAFIQFQYSRTSLSAIKQFFNQVKIDFVPLNIPPALVYRAWNTIAPSDVGAENDDL